MKFSAILYDNDNNTIKVLGMYKIIVIAIRIHHKSIAVNRYYKCALQRSDV